MNINGTLINYYFHCKRQCYLFAHRLNLEDNSENVRIGRVLHEIKALNNSNAEVKLENISIDKITNKYVVELKKSDADVNAAKMQVLLYLKKLKDKGIIKKGKLTFNERNNELKNEEIILDEKAEKELSKCILEINNLIDSKNVPEAKLLKGCKKCAYYEYCFL